jgi:hypothetical protein
VRNSVDICLHWTVWRSRRLPLALGLAFLEGVSELTGGGIARFDMVGMILWDVHVVGGVTMDSDRCSVMMRGVNMNRYDKWGQL